MATYFRKLAAWGGESLVNLHICIANMSAKSSNLDTLLELTLITFLSAVENWQLILFNFHGVISVERVFL